MKNIRLYISLQYKYECPLELRRHLIIAIINTK